MQFLHISTIFLVLQYFTPIIMGKGEDGDNNRKALCDVEAIHSEIMNAIQLLKLKQKQVIQTSAGRQEDDDDEIPYYVPAIAKVIAAVLTQNATSVIEESFGFIPPEVNKNIRYALGLVADTVTSLRPTASTTPSPVKAVTAVVEQLPVIATSDNNSTQSDTQAVAEIEALLAYALAQQIGASIGANISNFEAFTNSPPLIEIESAVTTKPLEVLVPTEVASLETITELFTSTFKYSDVQAVNSEIVSSSGGLALYAPAYAPNYVVTSTTEKQKPIYAPAFDYQNYKVSPSPPQILKDNSKSSTEPATEKTTTLSTTTPDDDDDDDEDSDNRR